MTEKKRNVRPVNGKPIPSVMCSFRLPETLAKELKATVKRTRYTATQIIMSALRRELARMGKS